jgi:putative flavoprotein involved in K+ transport
MNDTHAVILGAGPYGLSLAAHFHEAGIPFRIFGKPMHTWKTQMPVGMKLKSDGFASSLSAGSDSFTLGEFSERTGRAYHDTLIPVPIEDFIAYGEEFARRFVPNLEQQDVTRIDREGEGFRIEIETGESFHTKQVVLAMGVGHFQHVPDFLGRLPVGTVTHTSEHRTFDQFAGKNVTVLGRGASSLNAAVLLKELGADVTLIARSRKIHIHQPTSDNRSLYQRLRHPLSPLGVGIRSWLASNIPDLYRVLPAFLRRVIVFKHLGPAGGTALQGRVEDQFPQMMGWSINSVEALPSDGNEPRLKLTLADPDGETREHITTHIIAGTGYRVDLKRLGFLSESVRNLIRREKNGAASLNRYFESSVRGLYFVGPASVANFGPLQRFAAGARYAANRVTAHVRGELVRSNRTSSAAMPATSLPQR